MPCIVTIDGPAAAGKSTVARALAERLGWRYLDTGAMYRAVALAALREGVDLKCEAEVARLVESLKVTLPPGRVLLNDEDVTEVIRGADVTLASKFVADNPSVRRLLVSWQRAFAAQQDVVTEGRDQGTLVFPNALRKYYLTASAEERARRRLADFQSRGDQLSFEAVLRDQEERDSRDAARTIAPMKPAPDALVLDTTELSVAAVVERIASDIYNDLNET